MFVKDVSKFIKIWGKKKKKKATLVFHVFRFS